MINIVVLGEDRRDLLIQACQGLSLSSEYVNWVLKNEKDSALLGEKGKCTQREQRALRLK